MASSQISAHVSEGTKARLDRFARTRGMKKAVIVERALLHHLKALEELPEDVIVPPRIVLSEEGVDALDAQLRKAGGPSAAMQALYDGSLEEPEDLGR